ncbi:hypothetical protein BSZ28_26730 [Pseudomonas moraviensis]|nr:hypothetical protein BSZ28_26730 [Pseudomonas moraviensis]
MQPLTLRVIAVLTLSIMVRLERGASLEALPRGAWERSWWADVEIKIVPTLCVGMQPLTLRVIAVLTLSIMVRLERGASLEALPRGAWERSWWADVEIKIVPTLCVGMQPLTLCVIAVLTLSIMVRLERGASLEALPRGAWERSGWADVEIKIVPTLCVGMQPLTLCVIAVFSLSPRVKLERGASREALPRGAWERSWWADVEIKIVPTLCVGMQPLTLCVIAVLTLSIMVRLERGASLEALPRGAWERSWWADVEIKIVPTLCVIAVLTLSIMVKLKRGASRETFLCCAWE